jgi:triacylglycerol lipase
MRLPHNCSMLAVLVTAWVFTSVACSEISPPSGGENGDSVVLLHGLGRSSDSMASLARHLQAEGFEIHNLDYPSTDRTPSELVAWLDAAVRECCAESPGRLHFVTHSLGGILARALIDTHRPARLGRVVQIAPPNKGSEIVDELAGNPVFAAAVGPTGTDLGTGPASFPNRIGAPDYEIGIIAGTESINPVGSVLLPGPDDGSVSVERARLSGATDFVLVDANHTFIMQDEAVARQVTRFLREGRFENGEATDGPSRVPSP